jgi:hypothetical protein
VGGEEVAGSVDDLSDFATLRPWSELWEKPRRTSPSPPVVRALKKASSDKSDKSVWAEGETRLQQAYVAAGVGFRILAFPPGTLILLFI